MLRRLLAVGLALVLAACGTLAVLAYVWSADSRAVAGKKAVTVLVAKERIPAGTSGERIRTRYAEAVKMPASSVPDDAISSIGADLDPMVITSEVQPRQLLLAGAFGPRSRVSGGLSIPTGKLAVSVEMEVPEQVAGYVLPGSKVAVFDTFNVLSGQPARIPAGDGLREQHPLNKATRVLVPSIEVIAIGTLGTDGRTSSAGSAASEKADSEKASSKASARKPTRTLLVTVAATQQEAERLVHGTQTGALYLALLGDTSVVRPGPGVDNKTLFQ
jgi:pilus assembly protein CpaB